MKNMGGVARSAGYKQLLKCLRERRSDEQFHASLEGLLRASVGCVEDGQGPLTVRNSQTRSIAFSATFQTDLDFRLASDVIHELSKVAAGIR